MREISVLFSGGADSTLAALLALEHADRVHFLTYHHRVMGAIGKHRRVVEELRSLVGAPRVVTHEEEIDEGFRRCYLEGFLERLPRYRTFYVPWIFGACKTAMHLTTIRYNHERGISTTWDGAHRESSYLFPAQMATYAEVMREHYRSHGMDYQSPVYEVPDTDRQTAERGMTTTRETKREHVIYSTQHACAVGLLVHGHGRLYYRPFRGRKRSEALAGTLLRETLADVDGTIRDKSVIRPA